MFHKSRTRVVAVVATLGLLSGAGFLALSPAAHASTNCTGASQVQCVGALASTTGPTTVFPNSNLTKQPGGDWTTAPLTDAVGVSTNSETWSMFIMLDDVIPGTPAGLLGIPPATPATCKAASLAVGFGSTPTVTNMTVGNTATFTARLKSSSVCTGISDILEIDSTHAGAAGAVLKISGVTYNVGSGVATGPVRYKVNNVAEDGNNFVTTTSDAVISAVGAASSNAATLVSPTFPPNPVVPTGIPDLVIQEQRAGAIGVGGVCVSMDAPIPTGTTFQASPGPSVIATGGAGKGTPGPVTVDGTGTKISFPTTVSTVATTYTVTGLVLVPGTATGAVNVDVTPGPCGTAGLYSPNVRLATIGFVFRVGGDNRYATAAAIADASYDNVAGRTVVIARGDNFPDALAASYLAGVNDVPILLTTPSSVPSETVTELRKLGATDVVLVGGTTSITPAVATFLASLPTYDASATLATPANPSTLTVTRVGGPDRYATAKLVAEQPGPDAAGTVGIQNGDTCTAQKTAILASGENFPDALAAGGLAFGGVNGCGSGPLPMLLTPKNGLTQTTVDAFADLGIKQIILMGGEQSVVPAVKSALESLGYTVTRIAGPARQDTAIALANSILGPDSIGKWNGGGFLVARPDTFPDALAAASLSGTGFAPLYLAASSTDFGQTNTQAITDYPQTYGAGGLVGGTTSLSNDVLAAAATAIAVQP